jgi:glyoxylase-like metal-dependent hydrolase (beta-lactamase superfamily II)
MKKLATGLLLLALASTALSQDLATEVRATEAAPGIYMLDGANGFSSNMALMVGAERVVLIDDGMAPISASLMATIVDLAGKPADFVVNTHVHGDHLGSNAKLTKSGAIVFAHDNIRKRLLESPDDAGGAAGLPVVTFNEAVTFHVNGQETFVFHIAHAHTDGDAVIHFRDANVIAAGDMHFNYMFPFIDLNSGGSVAGYAAGQRRLIEMSDDQTVIIPGHGGLASKSDLQAALDMLLDAEARVKKLVDEGLSQDEVLAANPLETYHETWNWGFITTERMTRTLYRSLTEDNQGSH